MSSHARTTPRVSPPPLAGAAVLAPDLGGESSLGARNTATRVMNPPRVSAAPCDVRRRSCPTGVGSRVGQGLGGWGGVSASPDACRVQGARSEIMLCLPPPPPALPIWREEAGCSWRFVAPAPRLRFFLRVSRTPCQSSSAPPLPPRHFLMRIPAPLFPPPPPPFLLALVLEPVRYQVAALCAAIPRRLVLPGAFGVRSGPGRPRASSMLMDATNHGSRVGES